MILLTVGASAGNPHNAKFVNQTDCGFTPLPTFPILAACACLTQTAYLPTLVTANPMQVAASNTKHTNTHLWSLLAIAIMHTTHICQWPKCTFVHLCHW